MYRSPALNTAFPLQRGSVRITAKLTDGSSSEVFKGVSSDGREVVLKIVPFFPENRSLKTRFSNEFDALQTISAHQNVVKLLDFKEESDQHCGILAEEYCSQGSLRTQCKRQELSEPQILAILKDVASGLAHIHSFKIAHRDLRPGNVLLGSDFRCRIADFGSASKVTYDSLQEAQRSDAQRDIDSFTCPVFRAPEQLTLQPGNCINEKVDMWGLGCLIYGLLFRENAFSRKGLEDQKAGKYKQPRKSVSEFWKQLFGVLFVPDPKARASAQDVLGICVQTEIPRVIPRGEAPPPLSSNVSTVADLLKSSINSWVRSATGNVDMLPDPHYLNKLVNKAFLKSFKIGKCFGALQRRPVTKTRVAVKVLMVTHSFILYGPGDVLKQQDGGALKVLETVERCWHPNARIQGDELRCEYFAGLIRQYAKMMKLKLQYHTSTNCKGDWTGGKASDPNSLAELLTFWSKLIHLSSGLFLNVSELPELRAGLAGLLMEEKLKLMKHIGDAIENIARTRVGMQSNELLNKFTQNYQQTRTIAINLKRLRPLFSIDIPPEELPGGLSRLINQQPKLRSFQVENQSTKPAMEQQEKPQILSKPRDVSAPPQHVYNQEVQQPAPQALLYESTRSRISSRGTRSPSMNTRNFGSSGVPYPSNIKKEEIREQKSAERMAAPKPASGLFADLLGTAMSQGAESKPHLRPQETKAQSVPVKATVFPNEVLAPENYQNPLPQQVSVPQIQSTPGSMAHQPPMSPSPAMINANPVQTQATLEAKLLAQGQPWILKQNELQFGPLLGAGSSCQVFRGMYKRTAVAIKVMKANVVNIDLKREFVREITAMLRLRHPNLVLFMGASVDCQMAIVTEFCAGESLFRLLHERKDVMLSWKQKLKMCQDVAHGMTYLHESTPPIIHRDLKSLNLLLHEPVYGPNDKILVKITDFGVAKILDEPSHMTGQMGTCHWMAPEVLANKPYNLPADVYSFGIVMWEIVCRDTPYRTINPMAIADRVVRFGERPNLAVVPSSCPPVIRDLMTKCWQTDPTRRPTFSQVLDVLDHLDV